MQNRRCQHLIIASNGRGDRRLERVKDVCVMSTEYPKKNHQG
jgi:hypothetical protein